MFLFFFEYLLQNHHHTGLQVGSKLRLRSPGLSPEVQRGRKYSSCIPNDNAKKMNVTRRKVGLSKKGKIE